MKNYSTAAQKRRTIRKDNENFIRNHLMRLHWNMRLLIDCEWILWISLQLQYSRENDSPQQILTEPHFHRSGYENTCKLKIVLFQTNPDRRTRTLYA